MFVEYYPNYYFKNEIIRIYVDINERFTGEPREKI